MVPVHAALIKPCLTPLIPSITELGVTASTYASFAEIMTGFSFAAMAIYLGYEAATGRHSAKENANPPGQTSDNLLSSRKRPSTKDDEGNPKDPIQVGFENPIRRSEVAATLFYAIASLAISSFLYANLTTQVNPSKVVAATLLYGIIFGLSVLTFFYALTLMTYCNSYTQGAAKAAYLMVVIVGPAIVLRFLADAAQDAWNSGGTHACSPQSWSPPLIIGIVLLLLLLVGSIAISVRHIFEKRAKLYFICNWLCTRPVLPALVIFVIAAITAGASIVVTEPANFVLPEPMIWVSLVGGFLFLAFFALACGCVIGPRVGSRDEQVAKHVITVLKKQKLLVRKCDVKDEVPAVESAIEVSRFLTDELSKAKPGHSLWQSLQAIRAAFRVFAATTAKNATNVRDQSVAQACEFSPALDELIAVVGVHIAEIAHQYDIEAGPLAVILPRAVDDDAWLTEVISQK
jgi:hypothetical protein